VFIVFVNAHLDILSLHIPDEPNKRLQSLKKYIIRPNDCLGLNRLFRQVCFFLLQSFLFLTVFCRLLSFCFWCLKNIAVSLQSKSNKNSALAKGACVNEEISCK
ncbi:hypothetical protein, partial [Prevotella sp.]|uniref:hypothetical protein n=1 Tax=Prevotella sp. TaxID=59823 RepID=UPI0030774620